MRLTEDGFHLAYDGDIDLQESLEPGFALVEAGGDLEVRLPRITGSLRAGGTVRVRGDIEGGHIHGRHVVLGRQRISCMAISASESITIGAAHITADAIIAPVIHLDPKAFGRVTVIESRNERGATKIKGGFSVADYHDMFGNADTFLAERGLARLGTPSPDQAPTPRPNQRVSAPPSVEDLHGEVAPPPPPTAPPAPMRTAAPSTATPPTYVRSATPVPHERNRGAPNSPSTTPAHPPSAPPPPRRRGEEEEDDPSLSVSFGSFEPMVNEVIATQADAELHQRLSDALGRIVACYEGADLPPAVQQLRKLVERRDYETLRADITDVWNGLLGFHHKRGIRPHHQVTHAFNVIHGLVQT
ncbi:MAG: hypothetical protein AAGA48_13110 [Myxococcota bacterium]